MQGVQSCWHFVEWDLTGDFVPRPGVPGPVWALAREVASEPLHRIRNDAVAGPCSSPVIFDNILILLCFFWSKKWRFLRDRELPAMIPRRYPRCSETSKRVPGTLPMGMSRAGGPRKVDADNRREQARYQAEEQAKEQEKYQADAYLLFPPVMVWKSRRFCWVF